jgi:hypothetical protein
VPIGVDWRDTILDALTINIAIPIIEKLSFMRYIGQSYVTGGILRQQIGGTSHDSWHVIFASQRSQATSVDLGSSMLDRASSAGLETNY